MDIGSKIKTKRNELNLTQQDLAEKVFVTRQTISKWELGKSTPDLISLKLLEKALVADFFENEMVSQSEGAKSMNKKIQFKDILFTLLLGLSYLPLRILFTFYEKHRSSKFSVYIVKPAFIALFIYFIASASIRSEVLFSVTLVTIALYFAFTLYHEA